jgi:hypothetical protein
MTRRSVLFAITELLTRSWESAKADDYHFIDDDGVMRSWADTREADMLRESVKLMQHEIRCHDEDNRQPDDDCEHGGRMTIHDETDLYYSYLASAKIRMYGQDFRRRKDRSVI